MQTVLRTTVVSALLVVVTSVQAQTTDSPIPIDKAAGHTGKYKVLLAERSPLSKPEDVAKRASQKFGPGDGDYDLAKEPFDAFVPKSPAEDGKYGLVIPMPFPVHGYPPPKWVDVLESRHLIWLGDGQAGDGRADVQRIGLALDAVHNAQKTWNIDPARVYVCPASAKSAAAGIALYYPDVFQGQISGGVVAWYAKINLPRERIVLNTDTLPPPHPEQLSVAKNRSRFFFALRENNQPGTISTEAEIAKDGYGRAGFKHIKTVFVKIDDVAIWSSYTPGWFDQAIQFLDSAAVEANKQSAAAKTAMPAAAPETVKAGSPPPAGAGAADDATRKAAASLSLAKSYINAGQFDAARRKLQSVVQSYPNTTAAAEAKTLLKEIQDK